MNKLIPSDGDARLLALPFVRDEGGFGRLLEVLLSGTSAVCCEFRRRFSADITEPFLNVKIGESPIDVRYEFRVTPPGEKQQIVDLVLFLDNDVIGVELKVLAASSRKGQLASQYRGLRDEQKCLGKRVHMLFIYPGRSQVHREVESQEDDRAASVSWEDIFKCYPSGKEADGDAFLLTLMKASATSPVLTKKSSQTVVSAQRFAVRVQIEKAIKSFNDRLGTLSPELHGYSWKLNRPWIAPEVDEYYGPLMAPNGEVRKGQYLHIKVLYDPDHVDQEKIHNTFPIEVGFVLELKGGARRYKSEFAQRLPRIIRDVFCDRAKVDRDGLRLFEILQATFDGQDVTIGDRASDVVIVESLERFAIAFGDFLRTDSRLLEGSSDDLGRISATRDDRQ